MAGIPESCLAFVEDLSALIDGELVAERRAEVLAHVAACAGCSARLEALRTVDRVLADLPSPSVAPDLRARLARRIEAERRSHRTRPPLRSRRVVRLLALPAAAAAALALYLTLRAPSPPGGPAESVPIAKTPPPPAEGGLEAVDTEDLAVVLDLDTIEDLPVIANLEVLERLLQAEAG